MTPNPMTIIDKARSLIGISSGWGSSFNWTLEQEDSDIAWGQAPAPQFPTVDITPPTFNGGFPEIPFEITTLQPPTDTPNSVVTATYSGVKAALDISPVPVLQTLTYGTPVQVADLPNVDSPAPPLDYPVEALLTLPESAGLSAIDLGTVTVGERPALFSAIVEEFAATDLSPLSAELPEPGALPDPYELYVEDFEDYTADAALLQELAWAGSDGMLVALQTVWEPLVEASRYKAGRSESAAFVQTAAKGFFTPSPGLNAAILDAALTLRMEMEEKARGVRDDADRRALATVETSIKGLLQLEMAHFEMYAKYVELSLKAQNFNVRMAQELLRATVDLYNKKLAAVKVVLRNYGEYLQAVQRQGQTQMSWFDGVNTNLEAYEALASSFSAQHETVGTVAELNALGAKLATLPIQEFVARLTGIKANLRINRQNVESFSEAVRAYEKGVQNESQAWRAYSDGVRAATSALDVQTANFRAMQSYYGDETTRSRIHADSVGALIQATEAEIREYNEYATTQREYVSALSTVVASEGDKIAAFIQGIGQQAQYVSAWNDAEASKAEAENMVTLAQADLTTRQAILKTQGAAAQAQIDAGWYAAQANAASAQVQASLGIVGTNIRLDGGVRIGNSSSNNENVTFGGSVGRDWSSTQSYNLDVSG